MHIKKNFGPEILLNITSHLSRSQRSLVAQLRADILPLAIEIDSKIFQRKIDCVTIVIWVKLKVSPIFYCTVHIMMI